MGGVLLLLAELPQDLHALRMAALADGEDLLEHVHRLACDIPHRHHHRQGAASRGPPEGGRAGLILLRQDVLQRLSKRGAANTS